MKVEVLPIGDVVPYAHNAKEHPQWQVDQIANSIDEFGNNDPIAIDEDNVVIEGHGRLLALKQLGYSKVECIRLTHLTDEQKRAYILAHNKLTMNTGFDMYELDAELASITELDMSDFGFDDFDDCDSAGEVSEDGGGCEPPPDPVTKRGDMWILGEHRLLCGDSTSVDDVKRLMGGQTADLLLTDPPYNVALGTDGSGHAIRPSEAKQLHRRTDGKVIENDSWDDDESFIGFLESVFTTALEAMRPGAAFYIWYADTQSQNFREAAARAGMTVRQNLIWNKSTFALGRQDYQWKHEPCLYGWKDGAAHSWHSDRSQTTVLDFDKPSRSDIHPTMKPVKLFAYQMQNSSEKGDVVLDLFGGSGTTVIAAEELGRKARLMELDPGYCDAIVKRWEELTGRQAVLSEAE